MDSGCYTANYSFTNRNLKAFYKYSDLFLIALLSGRDIDYSPGLLSYIFIQGSHQQPVDRQSLPSTCSMFTIYFLLFEQKNTIVESTFHKQNPSGIFVRILSSMTSSARRLNPQASEVFLLSTCRIQVYRNQNTPHWKGLKTLTYLI